MLNHVGELVESCGQKWYSECAEIETFWSVDVLYLSVETRPSHSSSISAISTEGGPFHAR